MLVTNHFDNIRIGGDCCRHQSQPVDWEAFWKARMAENEHQTLLVTYTNWKGETRERRIRPTGRLKWDTSEYHKTPTWLLECVDPEDSKVKWFDLKSIHVIKQPAADAPGESGGTQRD